MGVKYKIAILSFLFLLAVAGLVLFFYSHSAVMLNPQGFVSLHERNLMIIAVLLMSLVVLPVFILTFVIAWKYREGNSKAKYNPGLVRLPIYEVLWWSFPFAIVAALGVITWISTHALNPYKPLQMQSAAPSITVQAVALDWKWLFIYPQQGIASLNFLEFPVNTQVAFKITSDAPMNSLWIPQLGGQLYGMPGMSTQLHLIAQRPGNYMGMSSNFSGEGFAGMQFTAKAVSSSEFTSWVNTIKNSSSTVLNVAEYEALAKPSQNNPISYYSSVVPNLYNWIVMKYMTPVSSSSTSAGTGTATSTSTST
ncbi:MAG: ubiquinol oxidase subunit II [Patescibacteria group bacterium]|nr:ubiquinol oxidase subunit II [Patescibacteria group bacterium]